MGTVDLVQLARRAEALRDLAIEVSFRPGTPPIDRVGDRALEVIPADPALRSPVVVWVDPRGGLWFTTYTGGASYCAYADGPAVDSRGIFEFSPWRW